ncbi:hypothetical protein [Rhodopirellula sp. P2]|uniref:hypothetical protein n=1 Tax=Rhodopirellula sp. P2 TaxID=2127060 RepID=UPI002368CFB4|nr:hypothetical protein [Rhodopirellula sp. P2]WDQ15700.1 hypothetical protein PSR62_18910 [Rhodopirellula sp. P2]
MPVPTFLSRLPFLHSFAAPSKRGPIVVASWDQVNVYFLVVRERKDGLAAVAWGTLAREAEQPALAVLQQQLTASKITASRLVLLLPRTDLEMTTVEIPPADASEVAALIRAEVEQLIGDGDHELVVDYRLLDGATSPMVAAAETASDASEADQKQLGEPKRSQTAAAFSLEQSQLNAWTDSVAQTGLQLAAFTSRQTAPLYQLRQQRVFRSSLTVLIVVYEGEVELSFLRGNRLASLRTFRAGSDDAGALTDQIQLEVQRSISLMDFVSPGEMPEMLVLVRGPRDALPEGTTGPLGTDSDTDPLLTLCDSLKARPVTLAMPIDASSEQSTDDDAPAPDPVLAAAAFVFQEHHLAVDLVHPKVPPVPPNPMRRWMAIAALAVGSLGIGSYTLLSDVQALKTQVDGKQQELVEAERVAAKMQEKADETRLVQQWLGDQVDWLSQLQRLSSRFPEGQLANVRRLSAAVDGSTGVIDLSVQVNDPNRVAELENALRDAKFSITSKRVSEQTNNEEYPWQFEARIAFPITPVDEREEEIFTQPAGIEPPLEADASVETASPDASSLPENATVPENTTVPEQAEPSQQSTPAGDPKTDLPEVSL